jgi:hypothetical protein
MGKKKSSPAAGRANVRPAADNAKPDPVAMQSVEPQIEEPDPLDLAAPIVASVKIKRVLLVDSETHASDEFYKSGTNPKGLTVQIGVPTIVFARLELLNHFEVKVEYTLTAGKMGGEIASEKDPAGPYPLLSIKSVFVLVYSIESMSEFSDNQLSAFANTNGVFNSWPFWREFVLNTTGRMGVPPITIPVFRPRDI